MRSINHLNKEIQEEYFHLFTGNARLWRWDDIREAIDMAERYPCHACYAAKWEIQSRIEKRDGWTDYIPFLRLYWQGKSKIKLENWLRNNFKEGYGRLILEELDNPANIFLYRSYD